MTRVAAADNNIPAYDLDKVMLGQGRVYMDVYGHGATPSTDMGAIDAITVKTSKTMLTLKQGTPLSIVGQWVIDEDGEISIDGWELNPTRLLHVLTAGACSTSGSEDKITTGGDVTIQNCKIMVEYQCSSGGTLYLDFWRCAGDGTLDLTMSPNDFWKVPQRFLLWRGLSDWNSVDLTNRNRLLGIRLVNPPS